MARLPLLPPSLHRKLVCSLRQQKICETLLRHGSLPLGPIIRATELKPEQVKNSLLVLVQHNCVQAYVPEDEYGGHGGSRTEYLALFDNILHRLRFPKFMDFVKLKLNDECEKLLDGLLREGRLTLRQMVDRTSQGKENPAVGEALCKLLKARYVERWSVSEPKICKQKKEEETNPRKRSANFAKKFAAPETIERVIEKINLGAMRFLIEPYKANVADTEANSDDSPAGYNAFHESPKLVTNSNHSRVGLFWDLDNKPPNSIPPYEVANKLRIAASSFGVVRHMVAYANSHTFSHVPLLVHQRRKEKELLNRLESKGVIKRNEPHLCRVCGRKFYTNEKLVNHFKELHEREYMKRLNQIESARGSRRVKLVAKYSMKMEKYKKAARDILTPRVGYGLADELKRAGFWVQTVSDKPQAADHALESHMVDMMDHRRVECMVLVSDDSDFVNVIHEAKLRCLKTVVVGDDNGVLKRVADAAFSWEEILMGKAKKEAVSVVKNWKDRDILQRLEWTYNPEVDMKKLDTEDSVSELSEDEDIDGICSEVDDDYKDDRGAWWELDSDDDGTNEQTG